MVIYQVFTRLFGADGKMLVPNGSKAHNGCGTMADFTPKALREIKALGATHVWYTGIIEHATKTDYSAFGIRRDNPCVVKGEAGSPYAIKDYYDVDPDIATDVTKRMKEFEHLIARTHKAGMGVIMDFVPNHVAREYHSDAKPKGVKDLGEGDDTSLHFSNQNNFYYLWDRLHMDNLNEETGYRGTYIEVPAKATGNDMFSEWPSVNDWYETVKLNYGVDVADGRKCYFDPIPNTWLKMTDILLFWAGKGIEGFRCDMAEMVPVEFWHYAIAKVKEKYPGIIFIAEIYNPDAYRCYIQYGGFDYLYDKVGLYDTLKNVIAGASVHDITRAWQAVDDIRVHMLNFLENHDEQRIASDFFAGDAKKGRAALLVSALMDRNPYMQYFGQALGEKGMDEEGFSGRDGRTTIFDYWKVDTVSRWRNGGKFGDKRLTEDEKSLKEFTQKVLNAKNDETALSEGDFYDLMYVNGHLQRQYAFLRHKGKDVCLVVANFADHYYRASVNLPEHVFEFLGLEKSDSLCATDLITGKEVDIAWTPEKPVEVDLKAYNGIILKLKQL